MTQQDFARSQEHGARSDLVVVIREVRRRWRMKLALRGAAIAVACIAAALVISAITLQWMRFSAESILAFRIVLAGAIAVVGYVFLARPLLRRVTDEQVALYLEEHEPSLEAAIISAVEAEREGVSSRPRPWVRKLVATAVEKCPSIEAGRRVESAPV